MCAGGCCVCSKEILTLPDAAECKTKHQKQLQMQGLYSRCAREECLGLSWFDVCEPVFFFDKYSMVFYEAGENLSVCEILFLLSAILFAS